MRMIKPKMNFSQRTQRHKVVIRYLSLALLITTCSLLIFSCASNPSSSQAGTPNWVHNLEAVYPSREWVAVVGEGTSTAQAEAAAMNALARAFRTDVESLTTASQQYSQIIDNSTGRRTVAFNESQNFSQQVNTTTNIKGLIGVQIDTYRRNDGTVFVCARMNRRECASRYSAMVRENTAIINRLLTGTTPIQGSFDIYAKLSFAHSIAVVTDNFQSILEVLDSSYANRKPNYGGANAIKTRMLECAALITIGVTVNTEQQADRTLFTRAAGSFFRDLGFRINESGQGNYTLKVNVRLETISQNVISCRYYIDTALENTNGTAIFSFTEDDRKAHPNTASEARRLAVRAVEESFKEGKFAIEFNSWLNSFIE